MSQIEQLQERLSAAMTRIGESLDALSEKRSGPGEPDPEVMAQLEEEKLANAQLQERLRSIKARHAERIDQLARELAVQTEAMARLDMDLQRLRQANDQLRSSNEALRKANEEGVGDPGLINKAMLAELEGLRATHSADAAEHAAILSRLEPLLAAAAATEDEEEEA